jgi:hypothetical protein
VCYSRLANGAAFAGAASITAVNRSRGPTNPALLHVDLTATGAPSADIIDVLVNYTVPPPVR